MRNAMLNKQNKNSGLKYTNSFLHSNQVYVGGHIVLIGGA